MKIAVTSTGQDINSPVDPRFGRTAYILIIDNETFEFELIDNSENINLYTGAGIQTAIMISDKKAEVLLTRFCGPNAFKTLSAANIKVVTGVSGTVKNAVTSFNNDELAIINAH